jgi:hypothetical protein
MTKAAVEETRIAQVFEPNGRCAICIYSKISHKPDIGSTIGSEVGREIDPNDAQSENAIQ